MEQDNQKQIRLPGFPDIKRFTLLGRGAYGQVYKGENQMTGETYALKMVNFHDKSQGVPSYLLREMTALQSLGELNHPNIVKLIDIIAHLDKFYLIFEFCKTDLLAQMLSWRELPAPHQTPIQIK